MLQTGDNLTMPTMPPAQCATYHCKAPARPGSVHCADHAPPARVNHAKRETDREYKTATWATIRARELTRQPLCQACAHAGRVALAGHIDHVIPWKLTGPHVFIIGPFQSLCGPCHSVKTGLESRGVFRHYAPGGIVDYSPANLPADLTARADPGRV